MSARLKKGELPCGCIEGERLIEMCPKHRAEHDARHASAVLTCSHSRLFTDSELMGIARCRLAGGFQ